MAAKSDRSNTSPSDGGSPDASKKTQKGQGAFDLWLQRGLHKMFDDVASEPIPEELLRLIEEDRKGR